MQSWTEEHIKSFVTSTHNRDFIEYANKIDRVPAADAGHDFKRGQLVTFTNDYGVTFENNFILGFQRSISSYNLTYLRDEGNIRITIPTIRDYIVALNTDPKRLESNAWWCGSNAYNFTLAGQPIKNRKERHENQFLIADDKNFAILVTHIWAASDTWHTRTIYKGKVYHGQHESSPEVAVFKSLMCDFGLSLQQFAGSDVTEFMSNFLAGEGHKINFTDYNIGA